MERIFLTKFILGMFFMRRVLHRENSIYGTKYVGKIEGTGEKIYIRRKSIYGEFIIWRFHCIQKVSTQIFHNFHWNTRPAEGGYIA
jgi:hypothetical protein